jgi:cytochrome c553
MQLHEKASGGIMSHFKLIIPAALVLGGFLVCSTASYGKAEYTKQTKKACTFCHDAGKKQGGKDGDFNLTGAGKYYKEHKSLDGYTEKK